MNDVPLLGLSLVICAAFLGGSAHSAMVGRWGADGYYDVGLGQSDGSGWDNRVDGTGASFPIDVAERPTKVDDGFPLRGAYVSAGLAFDGVNDYLVIDSAYNPIAGKHRVTIAALFRTNQGASGSDGETVGQYAGPLNGGSISGNDWGLTYDSAGNVRGFFNDPITLSPSVNLTDNLPHTMILTWQDPSVYPGEGVARLYVDGNLVGSTGPTDEGDGIVLDSITIGRGKFGDTYFKGMIGELRFYDSVEDPMALHNEIMNYVEEYLVVSGTFDAGVGSLRQKSYAAPGSTITFSPVLSGMTIKLEDTHILIDKNLTLDASALPEGIIISGQDATRVFEVSPGMVVTMKNLTITNGNATISAQDGGGIYNRGNLTLQSCKVSGNTADGDGGGVYSKQGFLTLEACSITGNSTGNDGHGGGLYVNDGGLRVSASTIAGNTADLMGGGMFLTNATVDISGSTFANNVAGTSGGGISNQDGLLSVTNVTIVGNSAPEGSGIFNSRALHLENTIVAGNVPPVSQGGDDIYNDGGQVTTSGANFIGNNDTVATEFPAGPLVGTVVSPLNPELAPLANYGGPTQTQPPLFRSPVIDAANSGLATDQRGLPRSQGNGYDLGAVEIESRKVTDLADSGPGTLRQAIAELSPFGLVTFARNLSGGTITLTTGPFLVEKDLNVDGSMLPGGITISGNQTSRLFEIAPGTWATLDSLTIADGKSADGAAGVTGTDGGEAQPGGRGGVGSPGAHGGGILNWGALTLNRVTLSGNRTGTGGEGGSGGPGLAQGPGGRGGKGGAGGAIYNSGTLKIINSTITNNANGSGGNGGSGITQGDGGEGGSGGGIFNLGLVEIHHSTLVSNASGSGGSGQFGQGPGGTGGGIVNNYLLGSLDNTIVALNTAPGGKPDLAGQVSFRDGVNFIGNTSGADWLGTFGINYLSGDPKLEPLGDYGGPVKTRPPQPGSPVLNAAMPLGDTIITDQRGVPRIAGMWSNDFSSGLEGATVLTSGGNPATGTRHAGSFRLTPEAANQRAALVLPDLGGFRGFSAGFSFYFSDGTDPDGPAEGFSFSFGPAPGTAVGEEGISDGHVIRVDTYENDPAMGYFRYIRDTGNPTNITSDFYFHRIEEANKWHEIEITLLGQGKLTVKADGFAFLNSIETGYAYTPGDRFTLGAGTGSLDSEQRVDNLVVQVYHPDIGAVEGVFVPAGPIELAGMRPMEHGAVRVSFSNVGGAIFQVLASPQIELPYDAWLNLGYAQESPAGSGVFQFTDPQGAAFPQRFYRVQSP